MLLVLPPSETKRDGGAEGTALDIGALGFAALNPQRSRAIDGLIALCASPAEAMTALKLGPTQQFEVERNRTLLTSPVLPAIERYTGVVYDALDATTLSGQARAFAEAHLAIGSALFGLLGASDPIPAYRLSHNSRLPGLPLGRLWRSAVAARLEQHRGLILDLRSESYAALGRAPERSLYLRVLSRAADGRRTALSHFNKQAKGEFARRVLDAGVVHADAESLIGWATSKGMTLEHGAPGELNLVV